MWGAERGGAEDETSYVQGLESEVVVGVGVSGVGRGCLSSVAKGLVSSVARGVVSVCA